MNNETELTSNTANTSPVRIAIGDQVVIYLRGKRGVWCADFHVGKHHGRKSLRTRNRKIAEQRARELEVALAGGDVKTDTRPALIAPAIDQFIASKRTDGRSRKTLIKYEGELRNAAKYYKDKLGITSLQRISIPVEDKYKAFRKDNDKLDDYTLYNLLIIHKTFLKWCHRRGLIARNPLAELELEEPRRRRHPAATLEQVNAILGRANGYLFAVLATAAFTGLRIGELQALRPEDMDLKAGFIRVRRRAGWDPKTAGSERDVPVHRRLLAILSAVKAEGTSFFTAPPSHRFPGGDNHINPRDVNEQFKLLAQQCGSTVGRDNGGLTLHALRRFFKTFCLDGGVPKPMVDCWMGHQDQDNMDTFYYDPQKSKEWMARVPFGDAAEHEGK